MAEAEVGDDWYGDDPTVNRLEQRCAEVTGKEAAVYVATGTMANQIALHVFVRSGNTVACEATSHVMTTEAASSAVLSGISFRGMPAPRGQLDEDLAAQLLERDPYGVEVGDHLTLENTHQVGGGAVMSVDRVRRLARVASEAGVPVYLDGARLFNAATAAGVEVGEYAVHVEALMFSLSKGLGAPIGSVLCGTREMIREARRTKVLFGGAWRQAGIMAAAGLVAVEVGSKRLEEDHLNARNLAGSIAEATPGCVDLTSVETNIVFLDTSLVGVNPWEALERLRGEGVLANVVAGKVRLVTHKDVSGSDVEAAAAAWRRVASNGRQRLS